MATEGTYFGEAVVWEAHPEKSYSREQVTVLSGESLTSRNILGEVAYTVPTTGTADGSNTGDGTVTAVTGGKKTQVGAYLITCIEAVTNGGIFQVTDPNGDLLAEVTIPAGAGATVDFATSELNGTITDGSTDFAEGDYFTVTVAAGSGKMVELDTTATDGSQNAYGILVDDADASAADVEATAVVRDALIIADNLDWPAGISAGNKAIALAELKAKNIIERTEVS